MIESKFMEFELNLALVQQKINYQFEDVRLLTLALTHRSYLSFKKKNPEIKEHNERLEFLGDAVLEMIVTEFLYTKYDKNEGYMTALRSSLVNYKIMGDVGVYLGLDEQILLSPGEKAELGKARLTIVADCVEAILGAIHLDGGYEKARDFVHAFILVKLPDILDSQSFKDGKTELQEYMQKNYKIAPRYEVLGSEGKDHEKTFFVGVFLGDEMLTSKSGRSKQDAETLCAVESMTILKDRISQKLKEPIY
jgi:ribonuclease III